MSADLLVVELAQQQYALPVRQVREVLPRASLTSLPAAPAGLSGILRLRGVLLPVVDLRQRLGLPLIAAQTSQCIIVAYVHSLAVGLLVDAVSEIVTAGEVPESESRVGPGEPIRRVAELSGRVVTILNLEAAVGTELAGLFAAVVGERNEAPNGRARGDQPQEDVP